MSQGFPTGFNPYGGTSSNQQQNAGEGQVLGIPSGAGYAMPTGLSNPDLNQSNGYNPFGVTNAPVEAGGNPMGLAMPFNQEYAGYVTGQGALSQGYGGMAGGALGVQGPQIGATNQAMLGQAEAQQRQYMAQLQQQMAGKGPNLGVQENNAATQQGNLAQQALARSQGGALAQAGAGRQAGEQAGFANAGANSQDAAIRAQTALQAQQQYGQAAQNYGQMQQVQAQLAQQRAYEQAQIAQAQTAQNRAYAAGLYNLGQTASQQQLAGLNQQQQATYGANQLQLQQSQQNSSNAAGYIGAGTSIVGGAVLSDENLKVDDPSPMADQLADAFLASIDPHSFRYKEARHEPRTPTGGKYLGVMAQHLEEVPEIGRQLVSNTPEGKQVHLAPLSSALAAGLGRLAARVRELEGKR